MTLTPEDRKAIQDAASRAASKAAVDAVKQMMHDRPCYFDESERSKFHELSRNVDAGTIRRLGQIMESDAVNEQNLPMFLSALRIVNSMLNSTVRWLGVVLLAGLIGGVMIGLYFLINIWK